jgi:hypothetical protein
MIVAVCVALFVFFVQLISYTLLIPDSSQKPLKIVSLDSCVGRVAYIVAYVLSLLRAPLGLVPYLVKIFIFFVLKIRYESAESTYFREVINMAGDFVNLSLTTWLILRVAGSPKMWPPTFILYIPSCAELVRLITERMPIIFSALWQLLPHRNIAKAIRWRQHSHAFWKVAVATRYCRYYSLSDADRADYVLCSLKHLAACDEETSKRLEYIHAFRIIPQRYGLRGGSVRDVAKAEVFIHGIWTNDPWLLVGMAMRRAPWMFDPRYLRRPFYYMTEANRLATLFVLEHARYSPPYAIFQFGHEIRVARLHLFYSFLRLMGADVEEKVSADGTFQFDQFIFYLARHLGDHIPKQRYLYGDDEVIEDILCRTHENETITAEEIATCYTYPVKYVQEVLLEKIAATRARRKADSPSITQEGTLFY